MEQVILTVRNPHNPILGQIRKEEGSCHGAHMAVNFRTVSDSTSAPLLATSNPVLVCYMIWYSRTYLNNSYWDETTACYQCKWIRLRVDLNTSYQLRRSSMLWFISFTTFAHNVILGLQVYLLRGNHEDANTTLNYGFFDECITRWPSNGKNARGGDKVWVLTLCSSWLSGPFS